MAADIRRVKGDMNLRNGLQPRWWVIVVAVAIVYLPLAYHSLDTSANASPNAMTGQAERTTARVVDLPRRRGVDQAAKDGAGVDPDRAESAGERSEVRLR